MSPPVHPEAGSRIDRIRARFGSRLTGIVLALAIEVLLVLVLTTLAPDIVYKAEPPTSVFQMSPEPQAEPSPDKAAEPSEARETAQAKQQQAPQPPTPQTAAPIQAPMPVPIISLSRDAMAAADISKLPPNPAPAAKAGKAMMGPPDTGTPGDTPRISGSGPNGEPLYRAAWYREPYDDETRGYLSTSQGPGWALINCRTVADFRIEDCYMIDEYPAGSNIARSVIAASWQFLVRPPRVGGVSQVGAWVQIRFIYGIRERR